MTVSELMMEVIHRISYTWHCLLDLLPCLSWFQRTCALYLEIQRCNRKPWSQTCLVQWRISCELGGDTSSPARQRGRCDDSVTVQYNQNRTSKQSKNLEYIYQAEPSLYLKVWMNFCLFCWKFNKLQITEFIKLHTEVTEFKRGIFYIIFKLLIEGFWIVTT
jgi:hypothetical protein